MIKLLRNEITMDGTICMFVFNPTAYSVPCISTRKSLKQTPVFMKSLSKYQLPREITHPNRESCFTTLWWYYYQKFRLITLYYNNIVITNLYYYNKIYLTNKDITVNYISVWNISIQEYHFVCILCTIYKV